MINSLATDFSKLSKIPQKYCIEQSLSDDEIRKQARTYIKQRILTNLDVPTWSTQFTYYSEKITMCNLISGGLINDKYIRYEQVKFLLEFIDLVNLRDFDSFVIYSEFDRESHPYPAEWDKYTERGSIGAGVWLLNLIPNETVKLPMRIKLVLFPNFFSLHYDILHK